MWPYWLIICTVCSVVVSTMLLKHQLIFYLLQEVVFLSFGGGVCSPALVVFQTPFFWRKAAFCLCLTVPFFFVLWQTAAAWSTMSIPRKRRRRCTAQMKKTTAPPAAKSTWTRPTDRCCSSICDGIVTLKLKCLRWWLIISVLLKAGDSAGKSWIPVYGAGPFLWTSVCGHPRRNSLLCFLNESSDLLA